MEEIRGRQRLPIIVGGTGLYLDAVLRNYRMVEVPENPGPAPGACRAIPGGPAARLMASIPASTTPPTSWTGTGCVRAIEIAEYEEDPPAGAAPGHPAAGVRPPMGAERPAPTDHRPPEGASRQGLIEEVAELHRKGVPFETFEFYGLEYRFVARYLKGELNRNDLFQKLNSAIHDFAKRQDTWFRRMERQGVEIHWLDGAGEPLQEALGILGR